MDTDETDDNEDSEHNTGSFGLNDKYRKYVSENELMTIEFRMKEYKRLYEQARQHYQTMAYLEEKSRLRGNDLIRKNKILHQKIEDEVRYSKCLQHDIRQKEEKLCELRHQLQPMERDGELTEYEWEEPINGANNNVATGEENSRKSEEHHNVMLDSPTYDKKIDLKEIQIMKKLENSSENVIAPVHYESKLHSKEKQLQIDDHPVKNAVELSLEMMTSSLQQKFESVEVRSSGYFDIDSNPITTQQHCTEGIQNRSTTNHHTLQPALDHPLLNDIEGEISLNSPYYNENLPMINHLQEDSIDCDDGAKDMEITMTIDITETSYHRLKDSVHEDMNIPKDEVSREPPKETINDMSNGKLSSEKSTETSNENLTIESNENLCKISDIQFITESNDTLANILRSSALQKRRDEKQISAMSELCQQKDIELKKMMLEKAESEKRLQEREKSYKMHVVERYTGDVHLLDMLTKVKKTIQGNRPLFVTSLQQRNLLNEAINQLNSSLSSRSRDKLI